MRLRTRFVSALIAAGTLALGTVGVALGVASPIHAAATAAGAGSLDPTFNTGGAGANDEIDLVAFGVNDKIYIAGNFTSYNGTAVSGLARLNADGTLDTGFNPGTAAKDKVFAIAEAADGKVYVGGSFSTFNGANAKKLVRLNADGTIDTAFTSQGFLHYASANNTESISSLFITSDAKVLVSGSWDNYGGDYSSGGTAANGIVKLNADGTPDTTFLGAFKGQTFTAAGASKMIYNADKSKITAIGSFFIFRSQPAISITRFTNDGTRDTTFTVGDVVEGPNNYVRGLAATSDDKYYVSGSFSKWKDVEAKLLIRINSDGNRDTTFPAIPTGAYPENIAVDAKDRLYVSGQFGAWGSAMAKGLVRLNKDGSVDTTFDTTVGSPEVSNQSVNPVKKTYVALSPAGKLIVFGPVDSWGGTAIGHIGRIVTDAKPGSVTDVSVKVNGTTATVSWKLPTTGGSPDTITATATEVSSKSVGSSAASSLSCTVPGTEKTCDIKGLVKGKSYTFSVTTSNGGGSAAPATSAKVVIGAAPAAQTSSGTTAALPATGSGDTTGTIAALALVMMACGAAIGLRRRFTI